MRIHRSFQSIFWSMVTNLIILASTLDAQAAWKWPWQKGSSCQGITPPPIEAKTQTIPEPARVIPRPILPPSIETTTKVASLAEFKEKVELDHQSAQFRDSLMADSHKPQVEADGPAHPMFMALQGPTVHPLLALFTMGISGFQRTAYRTYHRGGGELLSEKTFYNALHYTVSHPNHRNTHILMNAVFDKVVDVGPYSIDTTFPFKNFEYRILKDNGQNAYTLIHVAADGKVTVSLVNTNEALTLIKHFQTSHIPSLEFAKPLVYEKTSGARTEYAKGEQIDAQVAGQRELIDAANAASGSEWQPLDPAKYRDLPNGTEVIMVFTEAVVYERQYYPPQTSDQVAVKTIHAVVTGKSNHRWAPPGGTYDRNDQLIDYATLSRYNDRVISFPTGRGDSMERFTPYARYKYEIEMASRNVRLLYVKPPRL